MHTHTDLDDRVRDVGRAAVKGLSDDSKAFGISANQGGKVRHKLHKAKTGMMNHNVQYMAEK